MVAGLFAAQTFDFDYLGAHAGQYLGAPWAGLVPAQVEYSDSLQRAICFSHSRILSSPDFRKFYDDVSERASWIGPPALECPEFTDGIQFQFWANCGIIATLAVSEQAPGYSPGQLFDEKGNEKGS
jgi:hypothetical protein